MSYSSDFNRNFDFEFNERRKKFDEEFDNNRRQFDFAWKLMITLFLIVVLIAIIKAIYHCVKRSENSGKFFNQHSDIAHISIVQDFND